MTIQNDFFKLLKSAIDSINPSKLINTHLKLTNKNKLTISTGLNFKNESIKSVNKSFTINNNVYLLAFGKAALGMTQSIETLLNDHLVSGLAILPFNQKDSNNQSSKIKYFYGANNNLPDHDSLNASEKAYEFCQQFSQNDILLCLISGGGSALLSLPEQISNDQDNLALKLETIREVVSAGCNINQLNTIRSCLSKVKAGKLAELVQSQIISLVISDVINDDLSIISSGPTFQQENSNDKYFKALEIINQFNLNNKIPEPVINFLTKSTTKEIKTEHNKSVDHFLIGNNKYATDSIIKNEILNDYDCKKVLMNDLEGEAKTIGVLFAYLAYNLLNKTDLKPPNINSLLIDKFQTETADINRNFNKLCLVSGGETTVTIDANSIGKGGRNMELTLSFELTFNQLCRSNGPKSFNLLFSSFGTDGIDGPTDAAGAFYYTDSIEINANEMNSFLLSHNSYNYYLNKNRLLITGPTGSNVSDCQVLLIHKMI